MCLEQTIRLLLPWGSRRCDLGIVHIHCFAHPGSLHLVTEPILTYRTYPSSPFSPGGSGLALQVDM